MAIVCEYLSDPQDGFAQGVYVISVRTLDELYRELEAAMRISEGCRLFAVRPQSSLHAAIGLRPDQVPLISWREPQFEWVGMLTADIPAVEELPHWDACPASNYANDRVVLHWAQQHVTAMNPRPPVLAVRGNEPSSRVEPAPSVYLDHYGTTHDGQRRRLRAFVSDYQNLCEFLRRWNLVQPGETVLAHVAPGETMPTIVVTHADGWRMVGTLSRVIDMPRWEPTADQIGDLQNEVALFLAVPRTTGSLRDISAHEDTTQVTPEAAQSLEEPIYHFTPFHDPESPYIRLGAGCRGTIVCRGDAQLMSRAVILWWRTQPSVRLFIHTDVTESRYYILALADGEATTLSERNWAEHVHLVGWVPLNRRPPLPFIGAVLPEQRWHQPQTWNAIQRDLRRHREMGHVYEAEREILINSSQGPSYVQRSTQQDRPVTVVPQSDAQRWYAPLLHPSRVTNDQYLIHTPSLVRFIVDVCDLLPNDPRDPQTPRANWYQWYIERDRTHGHLAIWSVVSSAWSQFLRDVTDEVEAAFEIGTDGHTQWTTIRATFLQACLSPTAAPVEVPTDVRGNVRLVAGEGVQLQQSGESVIISIVHNDLQPGGEPNANGDIFYAPHNLDAGQGWQITGSIDHANPQQVHTFVSIDTFANQHGVTLHRGTLVTDPNSVRMTNRNPQPAPVEPTGRQQRVIEIGDPTPPLPTSTLAWAHLPRQRPPLSELTPLDAEWPNPEIRRAHNRLCEFVIYRAAYETAHWPPNRENHGAFVGHLNVIRMAWSVANFTEVHNAAAALRDLLESSCHSDTALSTLQNDLQRFTIYREQHANLMDTRTTYAAARTLMREQVVDSVFASPQGLEVSNQCDEILRRTVCGVLGEQGPENTLDHPACWGNLATAARNFRRYARAVAAVGVDMAASHTRDRSVSMEVRGDAPEVSATDSRPAGFQSAVLATRQQEMNRRSGQRLASSQAANEDRGDAPVPVMPPPCEGFSDQLAHNWLNNNVQAYRSAWSWWAAHWNRPADRWGRIGTHLASMVADFVYGDWAQVREKAGALHTIYHMINNAQADADEGLLGGSVLTAHEALTSVREGLSTAYRQAVELFHHDFCDERSEQAGVVLQARMDLLDVERTANGPDYVERREAATYHLIMAMNGLAQTSQAVMDFLTEARTAESLRTVTPGESDEANDPIAGHTHRQVPDGTPINEDYRVPVERDRERLANLCNQIADFLHDVTDRTVVAVDAPWLHYLRRAAFVPLSLCAHYVPNDQPVPQWAHDWLARVDIARTRFMRLGELRLLLHIFCDWALSRDSRMAQTRHSRRFSWPNAVQHFVNRMRQLYWRAHAEDWADPLADEDGPLFNVEHPALVESAVDEPAVVETQEITDDDGEEDISWRDEDAVPDGRATPIPNPVVEIDRQPSPDPWHGWVIDLMNELTSRQEFRIRPFEINAPDLETLLRHTLTDIDGERARVAPSQVQSVELIWEFLRAAPQAARSGFLYIDLSTLDHFLHELSSIAQRRFESRAQHAAGWQDLTRAFAVRTIDAMNDTTRIYAARGIHSIGYLPIDFAHEQARMLEAQRFAQEEAARQQEEMNQAVQRPLPEVSTEQATQQSPVNAVPLPPAERERVVQLDDVATVDDRRGNDEIWATPRPTPPADLTERRADALRQFLGFDESNVWYTQLMEDLRDVASERGVVVHRDLITSLSREVFDLSSMDLADLPNYFRNWAIPWFSWLASPEALHVTDGQVLLQTDELLTFFRMVTWVRHHMSDNFPAGAGYGNACGHWASLCARFDAAFREAQMLPDLGERDYDERQCWYAELLRDASFTCHNAFGVLRADGAVFNTFMEAVDSITPSLSSSSADASWLMDAETWVETIPADGTEFSFRYQELRLFLRWVTFRVRDAEIETGTEAGDTFRNAVQEFQITLREQTHMISTRAQAAAVAMAHSRFNRRANGPSTETYDTSPTSTTTSTPTPGNIVHTNAFREDLAPVALQRWFGLYARLPAFRAAYELLAEPLLDFSCDSAVEMRSQITSRILRLVDTPIESAGISAALDDFESIVQETGNRHIEYMQSPGPDLSLYMLPRHWASFMRARPEDPTIAVNPGGERFRYATLNESVVDDYIRLLRFHIIHSREETQGTLREDEAIRNVFPELFQTVRNVLGWNVASMARRMRVAEQVILDVEAGSTDINWDFFERFFSGDTTRRHLNANLGVMVPVFNRAVVAMRRLCQLDVPPVFGLPLRDHGWIADTVARLRQAQRPQYEAQRTNDEARTFSMLGQAAELLTLSNGDLLWLMNAAASDADETDYEARTGFSVVWFEQLLTPHPVSEHISLSPWMLTRFLQCLETLAHEEENDEWPSAAIEFISLLGLPELVVEPINIRFSSADRRWFSEFFASRPVWRRRFEQAGSHTWPQIVDELLAEIRGTPAESDDHVRAQMAEMIDSMPREQFVSTLRQALDAVHIADQFSPLIAPQIRMVDEADAQDAPAAITIPFAELPTDRVIIGPTYRIEFDRICTPEMRQQALDQWNALPGVDTSFTEVENWAMQVIWTWNNESRPAGTPPDIAFDQCLSYLYDRIRTLDGDGGEARANELRQFLSRYRLEPSRPEASDPPGIVGTPAMTDLMTDNAAMAVIQTADYSRVLRSPGSQEQVTFDRSLRWLRQRIATLRADGEEARPDALTDFLRQRGFDPDLLPAAAPAPLARPAVPDRNASPTAMVPADALHIHRTADQGVFDDPLNWARFMPPSVVENTTTPLQWGVQFLPVSMATHIGRPLSHSLYMDLAGRMRVERLVVVPTSSVQQVNRFWADVVVVVDNEWNVVDIIFCQRYCDCGNPGTRTTPGLREDGTF